ncbi:MAG: hypothetical protein VYE77_10150 [Planctomycetota bacterium]|nr:hypothetical protein [Planctomycetota bacterium]
MPIWPASNRLIRASLAIAMTALAAPAQEQEAPKPEEPMLWRLRAIEIERGNVFKQGEVEVNLISRLANSLHWTTDEAVVRREVWLRPGQLVDAEDAAEVARRLRGSGWFQSVETELIPVGDDTADLMVRTRDRFTLTAYGNVSQVGGVTRVEAEVAERNIFGSGKSVQARYSTDDTITSTSVAYEDRQFLDSWHTLSAVAGVTNSGEFGALGIARPFKHLRDPWSYGASVRGVASSVYYYQRGNIAAEIPQQNESLRMFVANASGPREMRTVLGMDLTAASNDRDPTTGVAASSFPAPASADYVELGGSWSWNWTPRYEEVTRIDTLSYTQDLPLGLITSARLALRYRDAVGQSPQLQPVVSVGVRASSEVVEDVWVTAHAGASGRWADGDNVAHLLTGTLHGFWRTDFLAQTFCGSATFTEAEEDQDLPVQFTLGEDNGLRGYPAREFAGQRVVRLNFEDRIDTGVEIWAFRLGLAAFTDIGFIDDPFQGLTLRDPLRSYGAGLRIGSKRLFGPGILRVDLAWPLDEVDGVDFGPSVSVTFGQVFTFFGNSNFL